MPNIGDTPEFSGPTDPSPGRLTTLYLDIPDTVMTEPGVNIVRRGAEVAKHLAEGNFDPTIAQNLYWWGAGFWTLRPIQADLANLHELSTYQPAIIGFSHVTSSSLLSAGSPVPLIQSRNKWKAPPLTGLDYAPDVATTGDPFFVKAVPAGASWDPSLVSGNSALSAPPYNPSMPLDSNASMDRILVSNDLYAADQGFCLRWMVPGAHQSHNDFLWSMNFGQYGITFTGTGFCQLWEYCHDDHGNLRWVGRAGWNYAKPSQTANLSHCMLIFPHVGPAGEKQISFKNVAVDSAPPSSTSETADTKNTVQDEFTYRADPAIRGTDVDEAGPGHTTTENYFTIDMRRDLRIEVQISVLQWATGATLTDLCIPNSGGSAPNSNEPVGSLAASIPAETSLTGTIMDAQTGAPFVAGVSTQPYAQFVFTSDGTATPILYGYRIVQAPLIQTIEPGAFSVPVQSFQADLFAGDPAAERAEIVAIDPSGVAPRLTTRGQLSAALVCQFVDPTDTVRQVTIERGYVLRPRSKQGGPSRGAYPVSGWRQYNLSMLGMHYRLSQRVSGTLPRSFAIDDAAPPDPITGQPPPYKVTDALRIILGQAGFVDSQINIPDLAIRLWGGQGGQIDELTVNPNADLCQLAVSMVRNYLGAFLYFEPNSGANGQWGVLFGTQLEGGTATPVAGFVSQQSPSLIPHVLGGYPSFTYPIQGDINWTNIEPNFNCITVATDQPLSTSSTRVQSIAVVRNFASYQVPGSTNVMDPTHPDYVGYCMPLLVIDPSLAGSNYQATWYAVSWTARRLYNFLAHGQRLVRFKAPLGIIQDPQLIGSSSNGWRPIRFQDPVTLDGDPSWLVKSVTLDCRSDRNQVATYELIAPQPGQYFFGSDGKVQRKRAAYRTAQKAAGNHSHAGLYGLLSSSPHAELRRMQLPLYNPSQTALQDPGSGVFYPMDGWNVQTNTAG